MDSEDHHKVLELSGVNIRSNQLPVLTERMAQADVITRLWDAALSQYNEITKQPLSTGSPFKMNSVDDVIKFTIDENARFNSWRKDGKLAGFRSVVKAILTPINILGGFAAAGASFVWLCMP